MSGKAPPRKLMKMGNLNEMDAESDDTEMSSAIVDLESCQHELYKLIEKENEEILTIEQKYDKIRQHHYNRRNEIIDIIPEFWFTVFTTHPELCNLLSEEEEDCLHYLTKIEITSAENVKFGYRISLHFMENPYFKNDILIKEFFYDNGNTTSKSTRIEWKKPRPAPKNDETTKKRAYDQPQSFFTWFSDNDEAGTDVIAEIIKDEIWPNPLLFYLVPDDEDDKEDDSTDSTDLDETTNEPVARTAPQSNA